MFLFVDDSDFHFTDSRAHHFQFFGGFLIKQEDIRRVEEIINSVKDEHGIPNELPIKWNFKDKKDLYIARLGEERFQEILRSELDIIREKIFQRFSELDVKIMVSFAEYILPEKRNKAAEFAYINLLQRYGFVICSTPEPHQHLIVMDRDNERIELFCKVYDEAYRVGAGYHSGPLNVSSLPYLSFSVSTYNPLLQMADLVVGCSVKFLKNTLQGIDNRTETLEMFKILLKKFRKSPTGNTIQWGIIMSNSVQRVKVETAIGLLERVPIVIS